MLRIDAVNGFPERRRQRREVTRRSVTLAGALIGRVRALVAAALVAAVSPSTAAPMTIVNESSLWSTSGGAPFTATIRDGRSGPELVVAGPVVAERTSTGERLAEAKLEIVVFDAEGKPLWTGSWALKPGDALDWRVLVQPAGVLDGALVDRVLIRDREISTVESRARAAAEARHHEEAEERRRVEAERRREQATARAAEARARAERETEAKRQRDQEARRVADIRARAWPQHIEAAVISRKILPGMSAEQVSLAWGQPWKVNQTIRASRTSEQWVYSSDTYVYFEDGRVTAIQTSR